MKYTVKVTSIDTYYVTVDAPDAALAEETALEMGNAGEIDWLRPDDNTVNYETVKEG